MQLTFFVKMSGTAHGEEQKQAVDFSNDSKFKRQKINEEFISSLVINNTMDLNQSSIESSDIFVCLHV